MINLRNHYYAALLTAGISLDKPVSMLRAKWLNHRIKQTEKPRRTIYEYINLRRMKYRIIGPECPDSIQERFKLRQELGDIMKRYPDIKSRYIGSLDEHYAKGVNLPVSHESQDIDSNF